jgi:hypothetical protein
MNVTVLCNTYHCSEECDEHAYCDKHYNEAVSEAFEEGKKEGYDAAEQEFKN